MSDVLHLELFEAVGHDTELLLHGGHHLVAVGMMRRWMVAHLVPVLPRADGGVYGVHQAVLGGILYCCSIKHCITRSQYIALTRTRVGRSLRMDGWSASWPEPPRTIILQHKTTYQQLSFSKPTKI